jgi:hypothetical protein
VPSRSRNKATAFAASLSALIAIFAEHSTLTNQRTIILGTDGDRDEAP